MQTDHWLPLTEYALRSGMSISTLRRKIKANSIDFKMEDGRYLIRSDELEDVAMSGQGYASSDEARPVVNSVIAEPQRVEPLRAPPASPAVPKDPPPVPFSLQDELRVLKKQIDESREEGALRWRALEARVAGIAKKLDYYAEQMAEMKMLVKIFEEKLDERL